MTDDVDRVTVRAETDIGEFAGTDGRDYDIREGDVATIPVENADPFAEKGAVTILDESRDGDGPDENDAVDFAGPPEPVVSDDDNVEFLYVTEIQPGDQTRLDRVDLGTLECLKCGATVECPAPDGKIDEPDECPSCERQGRFTHAGDVDETDVEAARRALDSWHPPSDIDRDRFGDLWADVREYIRDHWDAGTGDDADATYAGLTAYALSTWLRPNLPFVPHLMLMGKTTGGKTRLLNTLSRVSYRALVAASATPASMFRFIDNHRVSYYISEYHGLHPDTRRELDAVVRAGQKENEVVTRAEPTNTGHEPQVFDPFTHVAIATQYEPDDDIVNRCIQIHSSTAGRDMPPTLDDERARDIRDGLLYARYRLLESDEWADAEAAAYAYLNDRDITGRTREKLVGLLAVAHVWDRVDEFAPFVETIATQDKQAAADSEDALVVEAIRNLAVDKVADDPAVGDPFSTIAIPYSEIADRYEDMTGTEKTSAWVGHVRKRLGFEKERTRDGTVIRDEDLGSKLKELCEDLNLDWGPDAGSQSDDGDGETDGDRGPSDGVSQSDAMQSVRSTLDRLAADRNGGYVPRDDVVDELDGDIGDRDPDRLIDNLLESGDVWEPRDGFLATT